MNKFQIKSFTGGISEFKNRGIAGSFQYGRNLYINEDENIITNNYGFTSIGSVSDLINFFVPSIHGKIYGFGSTGKVYEIDPSTNDVSLKYTDPDGEIKGASEWYLANGNIYLYFATLTRLKRKTTVGDPNWSYVEIIAANLFQTTWHTMKVAMGQLLIANRNTLALVGYDGSYTNNALDTFKLNEIISLNKRASGVLIGTKKTTDEGTASLFSWDTMSMSWNAEKELPYSPIYALVDTDIPLGFCGDGYLIYTDMVNNIPILQIKGGGKVKPSGMIQHKGQAVMGVYDNANGDNGLYTYGRNFKNQNHILNFRHYVPGSPELGAVLSYNGKLYFSYKSGSNFYLMKEANTYSPQAIYRSLILEPSPEILRDFNWVNAVVYTKPIPTGTSIDLYYKTDKTTNYQQAIPTSSNYEGNSVVSFNIGDIGKWIEIELRLNATPTARPEVKMVEVYFDWIWYIIHKQ